VSGRFPRLFLILKAAPPENETVISLKKYLDMDPSEPSSPSPQPDLNELSSVILESYRSALLAMGKSGARAFPTAGSDLQQSLASLENRLAANVTASLVKETETQVEEQLLQWGGCTADYFKTKTNEVKELLIVLARTAESMGERDHRYANHFSEFRAQLQTIADLEDLAQVRSTLVRQANDLKTYVDQMAQDSRESVAQLQAEVSTYETKLKAVEQLASQDSLTGLSNRRKVEERIEWRIAHQQVFCVVILDLDRFKPVNDTYGHSTGDNLLQQFSQELRSNARATDIVGRWGGDEFIMVLDCDLNTAMSRVERIQKWVLGEYTIQPAAGAKEAKVKLNASIGIAQWQSGETRQGLIARADSAMYREKALTKKAGR
jgi:diguanylate cyclase (GGDEF)-like protein